MLSRRARCFEENALRLASGGRLYLWTFTRKTADDYAVTRKGWNHLLSKLRLRYPDWMGLRVYEVHPGKWNEFSHGLHVHVMCNARFDVDVIRSIVRNVSGWGRIHVVRVKTSHWRYLTKYLWKPRPDCLKGWRLWAVFGMPDRVRLCDILIDSLRARLFRFAASCPEWKSVSWPDKVRTIHEWQWQVGAGVSYLFAWGQRMEMPLVELPPVHQSWERVGVGSRQRLMPSLMEGAVTDSI